MTCWVSQGGAGLLQDQDGAESKAVLVLYDGGASCANAVRPYAWSGPGSCAGDNCRGPDLALGLPAAEYHRKAALSLLLAFSGRS